VGEEIPLQRGHQREVSPLEIIILPLLAHSVKTVADRHRLAAHHNKHCWRAFQWYQHRWPWTTLNPKLLTCRVNNGGPIWSNFHAISQSKNKAT